MGLTLTHKLQTFSLQGKHWHNLTDIDIYIDIEIMRLQL